MNIRVHDDNIEALTAEAERLGTTPPKLANAILMRELAVGLAGTRPVYVPPGYRENFASEVLGSPLGTAEHMWAFLYRNRQGLWVTSGFVMPLTDGGNCVVIHEPNGQTEMSLPRDAIVAWVRVAGGDVIGAYAENTMRAIERWMQYEALQVTRTTYNMLVNNRRWRLAG